MAILVQWNNETKLWYVHGKHTGVTTVLSQAIDLL